jgi:ribosomal 50S subunit-recycling heat shock protein
MRLDKYLKVSRLIKRRSVAKTASLSDRILVNGRLAKPSKEVNIGDTLEITYGTKVLVVKVTALVDSTKKADASLMYELICEKNIEQES